MAMATSGQALVLDWLLTTSAATRPTAWYVSLHTGAAGANLASNEIVGNGYARQAETFTRASNVCTAVSNLTFGPDTTANWGSATDFGLWTAASGGTPLWGGTFASAVSFAVGDSATIAGSALTFTLT
jgi:hypothetical protein